MLVPIAVVANKLGRLEYVHRWGGVEPGPDLGVAGRPGPGVAGGPGHGWQTAVNNGWSTQADWAWPTGVPLPYATSGGYYETGRVARLGRNEDGRLEVFAASMFTDAGGRVRLQHKWQVKPEDSEHWTGWADMPFLYDMNFVLGRNEDGRLEVFRVTPDHEVVHSYQKHPNSDWTDGEAMGGDLHDGHGLGIGRNGNGALELFGVGSANRQLYHRWQRDKNSDWVKNWESLRGSVQGCPAVAENPADGTLEVFVRAFKDSDLRHIWQVPSRRGGWGDWASLGGTWNVGVTPVPCHTASGRLAVFMVGTDSKIYYITRPAGGGNWDGWRSLGGNTGADPAAAQNKDGHVELFAVGEDGVLRHNWETGPDTWNGWIDC